MSRPEDIERIIRRLRIRTSSEADRRILRDGFAALARAAQRGASGAVWGVWQRFLVSRMAKIAAAAALIFIAFGLLLFMARGRQGITLRQIYQALEQAGNVSVLRFARDETEPYQQIWASKSLKVSLFKTRRAGEVEFALWDIANKVRKRRYLGSKLVETIAVPEEVLARYAKAGTAIPGLLAFSQLTEAPEGAEWRRVEDADIAAIVPGTEVYELSWIVESPPTGMVEYKKWRTYIDPQTKLPRRTEWYSKRLAEDRYEFEGFNVLTYPSDSEVQSLLEGTFGPRGELSTLPEYIATPEDSADRED